MNWHALPIRTARRTDLVDITDAVARVCAETGSTGGLVVVYCPHTTAGVVIQEAEPGLLRDLEAWLFRAIPSEGDYRHNQIDDNAASHLRAVVTGASAVVPLHRGRLALGTWQRIIFVELDGPRERMVQVGVIAARDEAPRSYDDALP